MRIGVISDTHNFLDPHIADLFAGVDHILHGGDIGTAWIIMQLESIAPVTAVLGNTDQGISFRETELVELGGKRFLVHHIVDLSQPAAAVHSRIRRAKPDVVIFGHTHKPHEERRDGILFLNPGYAGKARFDLPRSIALLECSDGQVSVEFKSL
jgi:putative phosphoesterase